MATRWEYAQITRHEGRGGNLRLPGGNEALSGGSMFETLNTLGDTGWELISCIYTPAGDTEVYTLKREITGAQ